jgi:hypothetical protein
MSSDSNAQESSETREAVAKLLRPVVGEFVTKTAISMASKRIGKTPETIQRGDVPELANALRPALRTLIGTPAADALVARIKNLDDGDERAGGATP